DVTLYIAIFIARADCDSAVVRQSQGVNRALRRKCCQLCCRCRRPDPSELIARQSEVAGLLVPSHGSHSMQWRGARRRDQLSRRNIDDANGTARNRQFRAIGTEGKLALHDRGNPFGKRTSALPRGSFEQDDFAIPLHGKPFAVWTEGDVSYGGVLDVLF